MSAPEGLQLDGVILIHVDGEDMSVAVLDTLPRDTHAGPRLIS